MKLSEYCIQKRQKMNLSVRSFATQKGVSATYISKIESGIHDSPSTLVFANIIKTYGFDSNDIAQIDGFNKTEEFMKEVDYNINKEKIGTERINNINNAILRFYSSFVLQKYCPIDDFYQTYGDNFNLNNYYLSKAKNVYDLCYADKQGNNHYAYFLDDLATVRSSVDYDKVEANLNKVILNLIKGNYTDDIVNITFVTSSEKVLSVISEIFYNGVHHLKNVNIDCVLSRPSRQTLGPININNLRKFVKDNHMD